jgi:hypothetical protein
MIAYMLVGNIASQKKKKENKRAVFHDYILLWLF